jgi:hypothetical protein
MTHRAAVARRAIDALRRGSIGQNSCDPGRNHPKSKGKKTIGHLSYM